VIEVARTPLGGISLEPKALSRLVREAAESAGGVKVVRAAFSLEEDGATVTFTAPRRAVLPELGALVQQRVAEALQQVLEAPPARVDVTIEGVHDDGDEG